ncbi:MAG: hypothetical protein P8X92_07820 [Dehalococcoidia bacterium]|jgi:hypothetical protein
MGRTISKIAGPTGTITAEDLEYKTIREDWNVYELEDGTKLKAKIIAHKISRALDKDGKSILYTDDGEPFYNIRYTVSISAEVPERLMKK